MVQMLTIGFAESDRERRLLTVRGARTSYHALDVALFIFVKPPDLTR